MQQTVGKKTVTKVRKQPKDKNASKMTRNARSKSTTRLIKMSVFEVDSFNIGQQLG